MREDDDGEGNKMHGDRGGWLSRERGNRLSRCTGTPGQKCASNAHARHNLQMRSQRLWLFA